MSFVQRKNDTFSKAMKERVTLVIIIYLVIAFAISIYIAYLATYGGSHDAVCNTLTEHNWDTSDVFKCHLGDFDVINNYTLFVEIMVQFILLITGTLFLSFIVAFISDLILWHACKIDFGVWNAYCVVLWLNILMVIIVN